MPKELNFFELEPEFLYNALAADSHDYLYIWDLVTDTVLVSPNMAKDFDLPGVKLIHYMEQWLSRVHARDITRVRETFRALVASRENKLDLEYQIQLVTGEYIWVNIRGRIRRDPETGQALTLVGLMHNLEYDGEIDLVTGLFRVSKCKEHFETAKQENFAQHGAMLLLGIDEFSAVNALNSHNFGDQILRDTVQEIQKMLPVSALMYRSDGDQTLIVGYEQTADTMHEIYQQIKTYTSAPHLVDGRSCNFTVSGGLVSFPEDADTWPELERRLSVALKKAKESGKKQCMRFTGLMLEELLREQSLNQMMADSIHQNFTGFHTVYQPVCEAQTLTIVGAETLLRFDTLDGQTVNPLEFIPLLEQSQLIIPVGIWVLEQAIKTCKRWAAYIPDFVMNVNVSYIQLHDPNFCAKIEALLKKYDLDICHLTLELTESYFITDAPNIRASLKRLKELHLQMAMDDFGTGYSSLAQLSKFSVDVVKIDKIFVQSLNRSRYNYEFVESVVRLCHNVGMKVCVEGVETREEQQVVNLLNVDYIQGFYVSRPVDEDLFFQTFVCHTFHSEALLIAPDSAQRHKHLVSDRELLLAMMDATPLCLNIWGRSHEILACNEEVLRLYGVDSFDDFQKNFLDFSPKFQPNGRRSAELAEEQIDDAFLRGRTKFQWTHCKRNGEIIPTEVLFVRIPYQGDYILVSYTRDLRQEIAAQENIRQFGIRMKNLLDATPLCLNLWNNQCEMTMCNYEAVKLFGLQNEQEYMDRFFDLSPEFQPDGQRSTEKALRNIKEAFKIGHIQFFWIHCKLSGEEIPSEITLIRLEDEKGIQVAGYTRDLRPQIAVQKSQQQTAQRIRAVIDATPLTCLLCNADFEIIDCNQIAVNMFGAADNQDVMDHFDDFLPRYQPDGSSSIEKKLEKFEEVRRNGRCVFEWMYVNRQGESIPSEVSMVRISLEDEDLFVAYSRDLRELKHTLELNGRLTRMAYYDPLTGSASRANFMELFDDCFHKQQKGDLFAFMIFDFDNFKSVNDTYGHDAGDLTLKRVVSKVSSLVPDDALVGRFGGDEFMIQVQNLNAVQLNSLIQHIVREVAAIRLHHDEDTFSITISVGATFWKSTDQDSSDMLKRADEALYEAKRRGRNGSAIL